MKPKRSYACEPSTSGTQEKLQTTASSSSKRSYACEPSTSGTQEQLQTTASSDEILLNLTSGMLG